MVQRPLVGPADVHAGLLADRFEALEFSELGRVVGVWKRRGFEDVWYVSGFGHEGGSRVI
jgi:hypothetical protein